MKKNIVIVLAFLILTLTCQNILFASSVEIPDEELEKAYAVAFDFIYSKTLERQLKASGGEDDEIDFMEQGHIKIAYAKIEEIQPYVKLGVTKLLEKWDNANIAGLGRRNIEFDYERAFSYGGGLDGRIEFIKSWFMGYDLQYLMSAHKLDKLKHRGETASSKKGKLRLQEWHVAIFLEKEFDFGIIAIPEDTHFKLTPYIGVRYSDLRMKLIDDIEYTVSEGTFGIAGTNEADDNLGTFSGLLINLGDNFDLRLEGRFLDETAFTGSIGFKF